MNITVIIDRPERHVEILKAERTVILDHRGRRGDDGPPGPAGTFSEYVHDQTGAATEWIINHNLGRRPLIAVLSPGGAEVEVEVVHLTQNQARAYFVTPQTGTARCV